MHLPVRPSLLLVLSTLLATFPTAPGVPSRSPAATALTVPAGRPSPDLLRQRLVDAGYTTLPVPEDADGEPEGVGAGPGDGAGPPRTGRRRRSNAQKILDIIRG